ncbi:hypothetical protein H6P81_019259 [Aristolochia fimbriata]|uniref:FAD-binding FR-type domain-containing protein n=1 Tax=Aristolochia fimbriata TaxID=158543 RepID=A0AAV7DS36_ARIFI|nr:hypothetical protein H6P81_019259 [Aristolochia fimbriata]
MEVIISQYSPDSRLVPSTFGSTSNSSPTTSSVSSSAPSCSSDDDRRSAEYLLPFPSSSSEKYSRRREETRVGGVAGRSIENLRYIIETGRMGWKEVEERFDRLALSTGADGIAALDVTDFACCIGMPETPEFTLEELLGGLRSGRKEYSAADSHMISKSELRDIWCRITDQSFRSRIRIFFDLCGKDRDDGITETEIRTVISLTVFSGKSSVSQEEVETYAALVMEELDPHKNGDIKVSQLKNLLLLRNNSSSLSGDVCCQDQIPVTSGDDGRMSPAEVWFRAQWRRGWVVVLWVAACVLLFAWKFLQYRRRTAFEVMGYCLCTAKGAAETLKLNMALVLLPVSRNTLTWLRKHPRLTSLLPFNDNINFHKLIAGGIVVGVILHGGTHLACDFPRIAGAERSLFRRTIAADFEGRRQPSFAEILATTEAATGMSMAVLMAVAFSLATTAPRRNPSSLPWPFRRLAGFNAFWYSHHLFVLVYALLLVHSMFLFLTKNLVEKTTWMYVAVPVSLYTGERIVRAVRAGFYDVKVLQAITYPGKVLSLRLRKPEGFRYESGMYVFLQCPHISPFQWHPYSLTSAPDDDHLSVHIRSLGDWSYHIYAYFQQVLVSGGGNFPKVLIDGPYGAAAQDHVKYKTVVLIGLGIGATPFISVLKHMVHGLQKTDYYSDMVDGGESGVSEGGTPSTAYFFWVTREKSSFDWFRDVTKEVSEINQRKAAIVIEMHNYLTSANNEEEDGRLALIAAIQALHDHGKNSFNIVSKSPVYTHFGRPNWLKVFSNVATRHEGETIGVFYCGSPALAKELECLCHQTSAKTPTRFVFHKENY